MTGAVRVLGGELGGWHVAILNESTSLKIKNLGKVLPRLETLFGVVRGIWLESNLKLGLGGRERGG